MFMFYLGSQKARTKSWSLQFPCHAYQCLYRAIIPCKIMVITWDNCSIQTLLEGQAKACKKAGTLYIIITTNLD